MPLFFPQATLTCLLSCSSRKLEVFKWNFPPFQTITGNFVGNWTWNYTSDWKKLLVDVTVGQQQRSDYNFYSPSVIIKQPRLMLVDWEF